MRVECQAEICSAQAKQEEGLDGGDRGPSTASSLQEGQFSEQLPGPQRRQRNDARGSGRRCLGPTFHDQIYSVVRVALYHYPFARLEAFLRQTRSQLLQHRSG